MDDAQTAVEKGKKLGMLIASLSISEQEREAVLSLLPQMSEKQLEEFTQALEVSYLQAATKEHDEKLAQDLRVTNDTFEKKMQQINNDTNKALDAVG
jgi:hypothetical protein